MKEKILNSIWVQGAAWVVGVAVLVGGSAIFNQSKPSPSPTIIPTETPAPTPTPIPCLIKGNVSFETGEKIYHVPGSEFYDETVIEPEKGERMFCTEDGAKAAGFRAPRPPIPSIGGGGDEEPCDRYETEEEAQEDGYECEELPTEWDKAYERDEREEEESEEEY